MSTLDTYDKILEQVVQQLERQIANEQEVLDAFNAAVREDPSYAMEWQGGAAVRAHWFIREAGILHRAMQRESETPETRLGYVAEWVERLHHEMLEMSFGGTSSNVWSNIQDRERFDAKRAAWKRWSKQVKWINGLMEQVKA